MGLTGNEAQPPDRIEVHMRLQASTPAKVLAGVGGRLNVRRKWGGAPNPSEVRVKRGNQDRIWDSGVSDSRHVNLPCIFPCFSMGIVAFFHGIRGGSCFGIGGREGLKIKLALVVHVICGRVP